jgi:hypothetical protein
VTIISFGEKETRFVNFPFTMRDVFTKKKDEERKTKKEEKKGILLS